MRTCAIAVIATAWIVPFSVEAAEWALDPENSAVSFEATAQGNTYGGSFEGFEADITFDPEALDQASLVARIDLTSVAMNLPKAAEQLQGSDWFDTASHPTATFTSTSFEAKGDDDYDVLGELELKGATQSVVLPMSIVIEGDRARAAGEVTIDRLEYDIGEGQWATGDTIGSDVALILEIEATRQ